MQKIIASTAKIEKKINLLILLVEILHVLVDLCLAKGVLILSTLKKMFVWKKALCLEQNNNNSYCCHCEVA